MSIKNFEIEHCDGLVLHSDSMLHLAPLLQFLMDPNFCVSSCDECFQFGAKVSTILPASPGCLTKFIKLTDAAAAMYHADHAAPMQPP